VFVFSAEGLIGSQYGSEMVEDENSRMADLLADKVKNLKSVNGFEDVFQTVL